MSLKITVKYLGKVNSPGGARTFLLKSRHFRGQFLGTMKSKFAQFTAKSRSISDKSQPKSGKSENRSKIQNMITVFTGRLPN